MSLMARSFGSVSGKYLLILSRILKDSQFSGDILKDSQFSGDIPNFPGTFPRILNFPGTFPMIPLV